MRRKGVAGRPSPLNTAGPVPVKMEGESPLVTCSITAAVAKLDALTFRANSVMLDSDGTAGAGGGEDVRQGLGRASLRGDHDAVH